MADKTQKANNVSNEFADMMGMPRTGEAMVDMHNRQTQQFNIDHTKKPGDSPDKVSKPVRPAKTQHQARRKFGIAAGGDYE